MNDKKKGGCLCGAVSYEIDSSDIVSAHHCHCKDCQKSTGSGKATIIILPEEKINLQGDLKYFTVMGSAGSHISRGFCPNCGSPVLSFMEENPGIKFLKAGTLDNSDWLGIVSSFWSSTAQHWSPVDDSIDSVTHNPDLGWNYGATAVQDI